MPVITPPIGIQSASHTAKAFRQLACALAGAEVQTFVNSATAVDVGHGLVRSTHLTVTQRGAGVNMSVDVAKGTALVNGSSSLAQGIYAVTNDAVQNLAIATADAVNPRRDLVVVQVRDNTEDAGGSNDARLFVVTGTPAASPADPAIPAGCLVLARVAVAALASSIVNANITALAGLARGSNWNVAWGVVPGGFQSRNTNQTGIGASTWTAITSLSVTFTALTGRLYRVSWLGGLDSAHGAAQLAYLGLFIGGTQQTHSAVPLFANGTGLNADGSYTSGVWVGTMTPGSITVDLRAFFEAGAGNSFLASAVARSTFCVEDIGPA
jgi:hypothetical protein